MKALYTYRYDATETYSAARSITQVLSEVHPDNPFLVTTVSELARLQEKLRQSIASYELTSTARVREAEEGFAAAFVDLRNYVETTAEITAFGPRAVHAATVRDSIHRHDRTLHKAPRNTQINLFASIVRELPREAVVKAGAKPLLLQAQKAHSSLRKREKERRNSEAARMKVVPPFRLSRTLHPLITMIHTHVHDFAQVAPREYGPTFSALSVRLSPLVRRVKNRISRQESS
jgi:hypothetical protein